MRAGTSHAAGSTNQTNGVLLNRPSFTPGSALPSRRTASIITIRPRILSPSGETRVSQSKAADAAQFKKKSFTVL